MAKAKNKRNAGLADKVHNKRKTEMKKKKLNPFEVHINREKLNVLGKKSKHDRGLPGVSRAKAIQKRKQLLGTEMMLMNKSNSFIDRRIGEKNHQMSSEDRVVARFTAERAKAHKNSIYNLADDEILTHRGQTLEEIEKFDDPRSSDDEDDDGRKFGGLDDEFVSEGHFGGGVLSKTAKDGAKSHKDLIEQLIAESKKRKAEKQKEKEQTLDLTEKLDNVWKDLQPVVLKRARIEENPEPSPIEKLLSKVEEQSEDYDKTMRELKFDRFGTPSNALKNQDELAKQERENILQLEKERDARMHDPDIQKPNTQTTNKHRSADDLDDNFDLDEATNYMLSYDKEGKPLMPEEIFKMNSGFPSSKKIEDGISDTSGDENEEDSDNGDEHTNGDAQAGDEDESVNNNEESSSEDEKDEEESDESDEEEEEIVKTQTREVSKERDTKRDKVDIKHDNSFDNFNDLKDSDIEEDTVSEKENDVNIIEKGVKPKEKPIRDNKDHVKEIEKEAQEKIESFFEFKDFESDNLKNLLMDRTPIQQSVYLQKLIKTNDPSLAEDNKEKLKRLFAHLLKYLNDIFTNLKTDSEIRQAFEIFDKIAPYLYDLAKKSVVICKKYMMEVVTEKRAQFKKNPKRVPDLDTLVFFKLISLLYPTSDFRHPVVTPAYVFITEILRESNFDSSYSISRGIFLTTVLLEYSSLSKKYIPELVNFLRGIFYLSSNVAVLKSIQLVPPFRLWKNNKLLKLENDCSRMTVGNKMAAQDLILESVTDNFKIRTLLVCVKILREYFEYFNNIDGQGCIFKPLIDLLSHIELEMYPSDVQKTITDSLKYMKEILVKPLKPLAEEKKKPKVLRLYEPDVQDVFTGSKSSKLSKENAERSKLKSKCKKAMKVALREIRRDKSYVASVKLRQKIHSDNIRKEKVKQIYKEASVQQGELNKLKRMK